MKILKPTSCHLLKQPKFLMILPQEVIATIVKDKVLDVFDRACLILTCKYIANVVLHSRAELSLPGGIAHGEEETIYEMHLDCEKEGAACVCCHTDCNSGFCMEASKILDIAAKRMPLEHALSFFQRLDTGWNRSDSRFCCDCGMFRSTSQDFWDRKAQSYLHKRCGRLAKYWKVGDASWPYEMEFNQDANAYVKDWVNQKRKDMICPDCMVLGWSYRCEECCYH